MIGYSKGGTGYVLVKVDNIYVDITEAKGIGNMPIVSDVTYQPERRMRTTAVVIQEPLFMGNQPIMSIPSGFPGYGPTRYLPDHDSDETISTSLYSQGYYNYKVMSDIEPIVRTGDRVHFVWRTLFSHKNLIAETATKEGKSFIYKVPYDGIYCAVRDEKILMVGSNVLIDPVFENWESILRPTYYPNVKDKFGNPIPKDKKFWIQTKVSPGQKDRQGIIKHIGEPLRGDVRHLEPGDRVLYKPNLKNMITVEGNRYFCMKQDHIVCKIIDE